MNHTTTDPALPDFDPYAHIRLRIAGLRGRLDYLFSLTCMGVLLLIPVLFAVAHIAADGEEWNFATGEKFSPAFHVISSYAWRSPAGWAMVACMVGFAFVLGFISWHAAKRGPGFVAWFTAVVAAIAMVKMLEVAWYPYKPSKEAFHEIQQEDAYGTDESDEAGDVEWRPYAMGVPRPEWVRSPQYLSDLRSSWIHQHGIGGAQVLILFTIMGIQNPMGKEGAGSQILVVGAMDGADLGGGRDFQPTTSSRPQWPDPTSRVSRNLHLDADHCAGNRAEETGEDGRS